MATGTDEKISRKSFSKLEFIPLSMENLSEVVTFLRENYIPDEPVSRVLLADSVKYSYWVGQKLLEGMISPLLEPPSCSIGARYAYKYVNLCNLFQPG